MTRLRNTGLSIVAALATASVFASSATAAKAPCTGPACGAPQPAPQPQPQLELNLPTGTLPSGQPVRLKLQFETQADQFVCPPLYVGATFAPRTNLSTTDTLEAPTPEAAPVVCPTATTSVSFVPQTITLSSNGEERISSWVYPVGKPQYPGIIQEKAGAGLQACAWEFTTLVAHFTPPSAIALGTVVGKTWSGEPPYCPTVQTLTFAAELTVPVSGGSEELVGTRTFLI
jgi:hypothetical protein